VHKAVNYSDIDTQAGISKVRKEDVCRASPVPKEVSGLNRWVEVPVHSSVSYGVTYGVVTSMNVTVSSANYSVVTEDVQNTIATRASIFVGKNGDTNSSLQR